MQNPSDLWDDIKQADIHIIDVPEGERENRQEKKMFEDIITSIFPNSIFLINL